MPIKASLVLSTIPEVEPKSGPGQCVVGSGWVEMRGDSCVTTDTARATERETSGWMSDGNV
jgi:hypothetical protein